MAIYKLKSGKCRVQVEYGRKLDGSRDRLTDTCETEREAIIKEAEFKRRADLLQGGYSDHITLSEFIEQFFWKDKKHLRANTLDGYERDVRLRIIPNMGKLLISNITKHHVQQMINTCETRKIATNARDTLRTIMSTALELRLIPFNPCMGSFTYPDSVKKADDEYGQWLTDFSQHKPVLKAAFGKDIEPIVLLGLCCGLRKGEILGLDWVDVNFDAQTVTVRKTYTSSRKGPNLTPPKTEGSYRTIAMTEYCSQRLKAIRGQDGPVVVSGPVCLDRGQRMRPNIAKNKIAGFVKEYGLPRLTILSMRHSHATSCINADIDIKTVSQRLGHKDVSTTLNKYVKPSERTHRLAVAKIDRIIGSSKSA